MATVCPDSAGEWSSGDEGECVGEDIPVMSIIKLRPKDRKKYEKDVHHSKKKKSKVRCRREDAVLAGHHQPDVEDPEGGTTGLRAEEALV